ncbi:hypothetical protein Fcan01_19930 [Folsomia candida]|uniref:Uncharacterized protein n=1 Tax=Folsomia candida TaxID=158441 RepID=A0A226DIQ8_FOLCA|nr:hypothetical protein Fcan01_19930 [Folsomia candida]
MSTYSNYKPVYDIIMKRLENPSPAVRGVAAPKNSDVEQDGAWAFSSISEGIAEVDRELRSIKLHPDPILAFGPAPYIPYGEAHISRTPEDMAAAGALLQACFDRRNFFDGTRMEDSMRRIIKDYVDERSGNFPAKFKIYQYPLLLPKGSEGVEVAAYYKKAGIAEGADFNARAVRDFYFSIHAFMMLRNFSLVSLSIAAGTLCLTTGADYVGSIDDPCTGGKEAYTAGVIDTTKVMGSRFAPEINEIITLTGFIYHKADLLARCEAGTMEVPAPLGRNPTPLEFYECRWWDAALPVYFKLSLVLNDGAGVPVDEKWAPLGTRICGSIRKAVDIIIRYDELVDVFHDAKSNEPMNEVHVAGRYGGITAVQDYAAALAACVDEVATCPCTAGDVSHDYALDIAIGSSAWYAHVPHYRGYTQLAETRHLTSEKYAALAAKANHGAFITSGMAHSGEGNALQDQQWNSLTTYESLDPYVSGQCRHCAVICSWVVNRCLYRDDRRGKEAALRKFVREAVHLNGEKAMDGFFGEIVTICAGHKVPEYLVKQCVTAVEAAWKTLRAAGADMALETVAAQVVENHVRLDKAFIATHYHPEAYALRRGISGALSLMFDRTDMAPYPRIIDAAVIHSVKMAKECGAGKRKQ